MEGLFLSGGSRAWMSARGRRRDRLAPLLAADASLDRKACSTVARAVTNGPASNVSRVD
jgi:hypothetical protein